MGLMDTSVPMLVDNEGNPNVTRSMIGTALLTWSG